MSTVLQPILEPVNGAPDIVLSIDPNSPDDLFVFLGMALLEKVPNLRENPAFKMLLARLHNGGVSGQRLTDRFGVARSTLRRWGRALKSGNLDRIRDAFSGQGAVRKVTPEIDSYVRDRFRDLYGGCRDYSKVIRAEVERYFKQSLSSERLRWIFKEEREKPGMALESDTGAAVVNEADPATKDPETDGCGANSCERREENAAIGSFLPATRNYSLQSLPGSRRAGSGPPVGGASFVGGCEPRAKQTVELFVALLADRPDDPLS
jgi:transposase-like protein